jgi:hypothetical protein
MLLVFYFFLLLHLLLLVLLIDFLLNLQGMEILPIISNIGITISVVRFSLLKPKYSSDLLIVITSNKDSIDILPKSLLLLKSITFIVELFFKA